MSSDYDALAPDYHWLVPDDILAGNTFVARHPDLLGGLPPGAPVLDCACGIGLDAVALARAGYRVRASDGNGALVAEAERRAREAGLDIPFRTCLWEDLPRRFRQRFALVLCTGNAISHCPDRAARVRALRAMRAVLAPGGTLVLDSRNWDKLRRERPRLSLPDRVADRGGIRGIPLYLWDLPADWGAPHRAEVVLLLEEGGRLAHRRHVLHFRPFPAGELRACLAEAGFGDLWTDYREEADRYEVRARRVEPDAS